MDQEQVTLLIAQSGVLITRFLILAVISAVLGLIIYNIATLIFIRLSMAFSNERGTRPTDIIERGGETYEIREITLSRVRMENINKSDDKRSIPLAQYWRNEIHSFTCKEAYKQQN